MIRWITPDQMSDAQLLVEWTPLECEADPSWETALADEIDRRGLDV